MHFLKFSSAKVTPKDYDARIHYVTSIDQVKTKQNCVIIVDESDDVMFKDLEAFYKTIKSKKARVICFTATADDGNKGVEKQVVDTLGFKVYKNY